MSYLAAAARGREAAAAVNRAHRLRRVVEVRWSTRPAAWGRPRPVVELVGECGHIIDVWHSQVALPEYVVGRRKRCEGCPRTP